MYQKIWFFSLLSPIDTAQSARLSDLFSQFLSQWRSHGTPVEGTFEVLHNRFILIKGAVEGDTPSGCSIDAMRKGVTQILAQENLPFADASMVFYQDAQGEINCVDFRDIERLLETGVLTAETLVFDNSLSEASQLQNWQKPLKDTWLKRYVLIQK